ncbi:MAG TPA: hypothetical protein VGL53_23510 [Bryobacteraceae bacterium]
MRFVTSSWFARLAAACYIACHFVRLAFDGTRVGWTDDDPMNLYKYWTAGIAAVIKSNLAFWNGFYRPLGGLFYLPIYAVAGMNPAPYRWAMFLLLGLNALLVYALVRGLGEGLRAAGLAALFVCVHGAMPDLVYDTSSIYDVLCVTFSLLTLIVYTSGRTREGKLCATRLGTRKMPAPIIMPTTIEAASISESWRGSCPVEVTWASLS